MNTHHFGRIGFVFILLTAAMPDIISAKGKDAIHIISYNIRYDNPDDGADNWNVRRQDLADRVLSYDADIIGLQEAQLHQIQFLEQRWSQFDYYGIGREDGKEKGEYVPVFYNTDRYSLISGKTYWLSETPEVPGKGWDAACERVFAMVWLRDKRNGDSLLVVNTHWDHVGVMARQESARSIVAKLGVCIAQHQKIILLGDLNARPEAKEVSILSENGLKDTCPGQSLNEGTFNAFQLNPEDAPHIDYVFVSPRRTRIISYHIDHPKTSAGRQLSDHFPVIVKIKFRK